MTDSQIIDIEGIGPVFLEHSSRARRITITIRPDKRVRVAVPTRVSFLTALEFVNKKENWIRKTLARIRQIKSRQKVLANLFSSIDEETARRVLLSRLQTLARKHGFNYNKVYIRNQRTRWGSCSHNNNISLNMKILVLSDELRDYVLLHELVHTRVYNHGKRFWNDLNKYVPDAKAMDSRLRQYDLRLL